MVRQFFMTGATFMWAGCIIAISFMEAWLKFRAPVTLPIGLGIGKLVFHSLNRMEWVFAAIIISCYLINNPLKDTSVFVLIIIATGILLLQTTWLLPELNERVAAVISGKEVSASNLHWYFIVAELTKTIFLIMIGWGILLLPVKSILTNGNHKNKTGIRTQKHY